MKASLQQSPTRTLFRRLRKPWANGLNTASRTARISSLVQDLERFETRIEAFKAAVACYIKQVNEDDPLVLVYRLTTEAPTRNSTKCRSRLPGSPI